MSDGGDWAFPGLRGFIDAARARMIRNWYRGGASGSVKGKPATEDPLVCADRTGGPLN